MATRIKWRLAGFQEIRRLATVDQMLTDVVDDITDQLPEGYESDVRPGRTRSRGSVVTGDFEAILDNEQNNSLLQALANVRVGP